MQQSGTILAYLDEDHLRNISVKLSGIGPLA